MTNKKPLTVAQRKAASRQKKRDNDLVPVEIWVHKTQRKNVKKIEEEFQKPLSD